MNTIAHRGCLLLSEIPPATGGSLSGDFSWGAVPAVVAILGFTLLGVGVILTLAFTAKPNES